MVNSWELLSGGSLDGQVPGAGEGLQKLKGFALWCGEGALGKQRQDSQMICHTHPSSGRVDRVRSFHSAQKASRRSWFSSDTWQLSSEVAMIPSCSLCYAWLLWSPLNSPFSPFSRDYFQPLWRHML